VVPRENGDHWNEFPVAIPEDPRTLAKQEYRLWNMDRRIQGREFECISWQQLVTQRKLEIQAPSQALQEEQEEVVRLREAAEVQVAELRALSVSKVRQTHPKRIAPSFIQLSRSSTCKSA
jgi:hypothetical protein